MNPILENIIQAYPEEEFTIATGFNDAIIGLDTNSMRVIYSTEKCIEILMRDGLSDEESDAYEYFDFNIAGSYIGDRTPIWSYP